MADPESEGEPIPPGDAFALPDNETRIAILRALWEVRDPRAELRSGEENFPSHSRSGNHWTPFEDACRARSACRTPARGAHQ